MIQSQFLQAGVERSLDRIRLKVLVPDLGGDMHLLASDARCGERSADGFLVAVHFRSVDMAVAELERAFDRRAADVALHAIGAEPETGQADPLGEQIFHH
jgi:hypothetical protein